MFQHSHYGLFKFWPNSLNRSNLDKYNITNVLILAQAQN